MVRTIRKMPLPGTPDPSPRSYEAPHAALSRRAAAEDDQFLMLHYKYVFLMPMNVCLSARVLPASFREEQVRASSVSQIDNFHVGKILLWESEGRGGQRKTVLERQDGESQPVAVLLGA